MKPKFLSNDPRLHFAVNCVSMGCPPLNGRSLRGDRPDDRLTEVTPAFINEASSNRLEGESLWADKIYDWFAVDFNQDALSFFILNEIHGGNHGRFRL